MKLTIAIFCIAAILSPLAAVMAFLITYEEYAHHYHNKPDVFKAAIKTACFTFLFFLVLGLTLAIILPFCL